VAKITIPRLELKSEANSTDHFRVKAKRHKIQKAIVNAYMRTVQIPPLPLVITLTRHAPRPYDDDNILIAFKYVRDAVSEYVLGIADNKIYKPGRADNDQRIKWEYCQEKTTQEEYLITIELTSFPTHKQDLA